MRPVLDICEQTGQQRRSDNIDTLTLLGKWQTPEQLQALRAAGRKKPALMETAEELMMRLSCNAILPFTVSVWANWVFGFC